MISVQIYEKNILFLRIHRDKNGVFGVFFVKNIEWSIQTISYCTQSQPGWNSSEPIVVIPKKWLPIKPEWMSGCMKSELQILRLYFWLYYAIFTKWHWKNFSIIWNTKNNIYLYFQFRMTYRQISVSLFWTAGKSSCFDCKNYFQKVTHDATSGAERNQFLSAFLFYCRTFRYIWICENIFRPGTMNPQLTAIQNKIYEIRGQRVMLDLAQLYGVTTANIFNFNYLCPSES